MSKLFKLVNEVRKDEEGAAMAEYVVLLGIVVAVGTLVLTQFGTAIKGKFAAVCVLLGGACAG
jgi:pilus assembly protein Flp/PilA